MDIDHLHPQSLGGMDILENLVPSHFSVNRKKNAKYDESLIDRLTLSNRLIYVNSVITKYTNVDLKKLRRKARTANKIANGNMVKTKYTGVYYRISKDNEKTFYIRGKVKGKSYIKPIGKANEGITAIYAQTKRYEHERELRFKADAEHKVKKDAEWNAYINRQTSV